MRKEQFTLLTLPLAFAVGALSGCSSTPDVADYLSAQCGLNPGLEIASQTFDLSSGTEIKIGDNKFKITDKGRLKYNNDFGAYGGDLEFGEQELITSKAYDLFNGNIKRRFRVVSAFSKENGSTKVTVTLNCKNQAQE